jgi:hypothetical protein
MIVAQRFYGDGKNSLPFFAGSAPLRDICFLLEIFFSRKGEKTQSKRKVKLIADHLYGIKYHYDQKMNSIISLPFVSCRQTAKIHNIHE